MLTANLAADMVDYTRIRAEYQARMLEALRELSEYMFGPVVENYHGNAIKNTGDRWLDGPWQAGLPK